MQRSLIAILTGALSLAAAPGAVADGLPVLGVDVGSTGVAAPAGASRYVTIPAPGGTLVERIRRDGGQVLAAQLVAGTYTIPAVAYDGSAGGLSGDQRTLVLIEPRRSFPRATTALLVLDVPALRVRARVDLTGDFSFDAVSPDGSRLYLIDYIAPGDPTRYTVRSYSVPAMRLDPSPIVDPRSPGEKMRGNPVSRASGPGGRWAYTLYDGAGGTPFVHALDTAIATARCVDLDSLDPSIVDRLRLRMGEDGRTLEVLDGGRELASLDTRTFAVGAPHAASSWRVAALAGALTTAFAVVVAALLVRRRRRSPLVPDLAS